jgi:DNA-binding response OmpR family regulator
MARWAHILVVDDNPYLRQFVAAILQTSTCRVSGVPDGEAMHQFLRSDDSVDLVILDSVIPGERSSSLARHLLELAMPLVLMLAGPDMMQFAAENHLQLLAKPFRSGELRSAIEDAVIGHHQNDQIGSAHAPA